VSYYSRTILNSNPLGYYRMDDTSGTNCVGLAGATGTYENTPTLGQNGATIDGDKAVLFTSASQQAVRVPSAWTTMANVFSLECWVKMGILAGGQKLFILSGDNAAQLYLNASQQLELGKAGVGAVVHSTTAIADTTTFHHFVGTKNGATSKVYIDGQDVTGVVTDQSFSSGTGWPSFIASNYNGFGESNWPTATIDEVAVYNTELSAATVLLHFNAAAILGGPKAGASGAAWRRRWQGR